MAQSGVKADREDLANKLAEKAVEWITGLLLGTRGTGYRRNQGFESEIYGWLVDHAIFREEEDA